MLGLSGRILGFYAAFAFPFALLCALAYFTDLTSLDAESERRRLRVARLLTLLSPVHVLFPITALGIITDAGSLATSATNTAARSRDRVLAIAGIALSLVVLVVLASGDGNP